MRISVGDTILRAWGFAGRRILPLLGAGWLTAAFYATAVAYFLGHLSDAMLVSPRPDPGSFNNFALFYMFCIVLVTALANAAMSVPMLREAFEPGGEWKSAYFSIALREWSLFSNLLLLYILVIGIVSAIVFAGNVGIAVSLPMTGNAGVWQGIPLAPVMETMLAIIAVAAGVFLATRFGFFLATTAVVDSSARLLEAWSLSRGNFWRLLLGLGLGLMVPVVLAAMLAIWAICGAQFSDAMSTLLSPSHDNTTLFQMIRDHAGAIGAVWAVGLFVLNAIFAGASAAAYAQVEHGEAPVIAQRESLVIAEPAYAMAAAATALHLTPEEVARFEPTFAKAESPAKTSEPAPAATIVAAPKVVEAKEKEEAISETPAITEAVKAEAAVASPDAEQPSDIAAIETPEAATALPEEEPLAAHKDELPAMDPLGHAAPAAPDPSGVPPATPLPSFVKAQTSPANEPSEAA
jgi:hypothetical protein